ALAAADRHHGVDGFQTGLHRLGYGLAGDNAGRDLFHRVGEFGIDRTLAVDGVTQGVNHAAFQLRTNRYFQNALGAAAGLAFGQALVVAEYYGTYGVALEVEGHTVHAAFELDHLTVHDVGQAVNADDAVRHADDRALILGLRSDIQLLDPLLDDVADFRWIQLLHAWIPQQVPALGC